MPEGNLHAYAVEAESNLEKLATGLAQAQADPQIVKTVSEMADVTRKIVKALGKGQEQTGDKEPPAPEPQPQQQPAPQQQPRTLGEATDQLHQEQQRR